MQNFWFSQGLVKQKVDVDKLVDESFAQEAVKRLGAIAGIFSGLALSFLEVVQADPLFVKARFIIRVSVVSG